jgi:hypothetical protein
VPDAILTLQRVFIIENSLLDAEAIGAESTLAQSSRLQKVAERMEHIDALSSSWFTC